MSADFGFDLLYSSVEKDIKNNQDILVCLAHLVLVSSGFRCIGLGKSKIIDGSQRREVLPKGWNNDYAIRYVYNGRLFNFKATCLDNGVMLNLERGDETTVSLVQLKTRSVVKKTGTLEEMIPEYRSLMDTIKKQLFEKVVGFRKFRENSTQTQDPAPTPKITPFDIFKGHSLDPLGGDVKVLFKDHKAHLKI